MPTTTLRRPKSKVTSAERVKQMLAEIACRMHATRVVGTKPTFKPAK